ncbi:MAG: hypothetical protein ACPIOQ_61505 [Promethearchaeia archaeon]
MKAVADILEIDLHERKGNGKWPQTLFKGAKKHTAFNDLKQPQEKESTAGSIAKKWPFKAS